MCSARASRPGFVGDRIVLVVAVLVPALGDVEVLTQGAQPGLVGHRVTPTRLWTPSSVVAAASIHQR